MEINSDVSIVEDQIRECFARVAWTHKTHEKCADILNMRLARIKFWQIVLSAIITTGILAAVFGESKEIGIVTAIISFFLTIMNTYVKQYDLGGIAQKHADSAIYIWNIRESYFSLLTDIRSAKVDLQEVRNKRDRLQEELLEVYRGAPRTIAKAYDKASTALKNMEELTFSDQEIDAFLPKSLKKGASDGSYNN
ncbi:SLATT domain-containing protein [Halomonas sp.]|uniref:SLATT domain-containing protein n=1 Tax=Halomonas sp. TaxID=1486246 RepID=UPI002580DDCC|nr:SLATT domain-containing protein [Halomonas sp.]MCJ8283944.1 SLATT domain-containing protein [Halomonas sp.]NQY68997.1 SLATT domain-containing protein [Halomonas sp.]